MNGASKILTVSYGTFSCTLEGFDDSFDTMKEIAEYFRDLAADDRYFGAEPPTLDAEMLAKIASRNMNRQVEAKMDDTRVVLRPSEQSEEPTKKRASGSAEAEAKIAETPKTEKQTAAGEPAPTLVIPSNEYDDTQDEALAVSGNMRESAETSKDDSAPGNESVAAKLRRIRAVVSAKHTTNPAPSIFANNDEPDAIPEEETAEGNEGDVEGGTDTTEDLLTNAQDVLGEVSEHEADNAVAGNDQDDEMIGYDVSLASVLEAVEDEDDVIEGQSITNVFADTAEEATEESTEESTEENVEDTDADEAAEEAVHPVRPTPAHILRVNRNEDERAERPGDTDDSRDDDSIKDALQSILGNAVHSTGDGTDPVSNSEGDIPAKTDDEDPKASLKQGIGAALRADRANRVMQTESGAQDEAAVSRLLDETNAKLDTRESIRKRSAISHLRAAVAATFADRKLDLGDEDSTPDVSEAYRTDLADVVQPHDVESTDSGHQNDPAPLVLVSEQRIDEDGEITVDLGSLQTEMDDGFLQDDDAGFNNPAQSGGEGITNHDADQNYIAESTSFADFAAKMGATELPDLLEAAAAYAAFVEGQPHFGRPQIMRQVADFTGKSEFNREEGLRSFGMLLRQGKIVKIRRGKFEIAETTRFKPKARIAGE